MANHSNTKSKKRPNRARRSTSLSKKRLKQMAIDATIDAYGVEEQLAGWFTMMEDHLAFPFQTEILGVPFLVEKIFLRENGGITAICKNGKRKQNLPILDLHLVRPIPAGAEWIEAFRYWTTAAAG